ncbi:MAG TPA: cytochrome C [Gammaproteobacteria bacterium]|nr:cytochrome C [Gammaproteobacteria bacterium]
MRYNKTTSLTFGLLIMAGLSSPPAPAAGHGTDADALAHAARQGHHLFIHETFGGNGKTCNSCHSNGGKGPGKLPNGKPLPSLTNAAAIFPVYKAKLGHIVTLEDQIRRCIANALKGTPPPYDSAEIRNLTVYITSLAEGTPINMGGKPR